jgi:hypothetical protein
LVVTVAAISPTRVLSSQRRLEAHLAHQAWPGDGATFERFEMSGFEVRDDTVAAVDNCPSKGIEELGTFFYDSEGNLIGVARPVRQRGWHNMTRS